MFHKMYDNIASLRFDVETNGKTVVGAMVSAEGEVMELRKPVPVIGRVEEWMMEVLLEMRKTNRVITKEAIFHYCEGKSRYVYHVYEGFLQGSMCAYRLNKDFPMLLFFSGWIGCCCTRA